MRSPWLYLDHFENMGFEKAPLSRIAFLILQLNKRRVKSLNDSACIISAESTTFPGSVIFKYVVKTKCHYESPNGGSPHYSGQQKLVLRGITSGCCSNLARNQKVVASCAELL